MDYETQYKKFHERCGIIRQSILSQNYAPGTVEYEQLFREEIFCALNDEKFAELVNNKVRPPNGITRCDPELESILKEFFKQKPRNS